MKIQEHRIENLVCWETGIRGLFAAGEVCGSHGVTRPGGTALNAGQVGAVRAAGKIHLRKLHEENTRVSIEAEEFLREDVQEFVKLPDQASGSLALSQMWKKAARRMSASGGMIRNQENLASAFRETEAELDGYLELVKPPTTAQLPQFSPPREL